MGDEEPCGGAGNSGLEILCEAPASAELGEGSFHHPASRQELEAAGGVRPLDDLNGPVADSGESPIEFGTGIAAIGSSPATLWAHLARHFLIEMDHSRYTRDGDQLVGDWDIFLGVINVEAETAVTEERLCSILFGGSEAEIRRHDYQLTAAFYIQVLRPLCWMGLLEEIRVGKGMDRREFFTKTPLWHAALALGPNEEPQAPILH